MSFKDDWISWHYNDNPLQKFKTAPTDVWNLQINPKFDRPVQSFYEEVLANACLIRDSFAEPLDLLLSGGGDSELALRVYCELKIPVNVITFRYNDNLNYKELEYSYDLCRELNVNQIIIDFDLKKFFENEAYEIWQTGYYLNAGRLVHMKMIEYSDNIPMIFDGITQSPFAVVQKDNKWQFGFQEVNFSLAQYSKYINRNVISNWFDFSPSIVTAFLHLPIIQQLGNNRLLTLTSYSDIKYRIINQFWPKIKIRNKLHGFEGDAPAGHHNSRPDYMLKFNEEYVLNKVTETNYMYTREELLSLLQS
jgi:hypothetical protein